MSGAQRGTTDVAIHCRWSLCLRFRCTELALQAFAEQVVQQRLPLTRVCSKVNPFRALAERTTPDNSLVQDHAYLLVYRHDSACAHPTAARKALD